MSDLEEIAQIRELKARYLRCLDRKLWTEMRTLLADDATSAYDGGRYTYDSPEEIVQFMADSMGADHIVTQHQCHHPEIELTSPTTATGTWYLTDFCINEGPAHFGFQENVTLFGAAFYNDRYVKIDGEWKIQFTGYERTFEMQTSRAEAKTLAVTTCWQAQAGSA